MDNNAGSPSTPNSSSSKIQSFLEALKASRARTFETGNFEPGSNPFSEIRQKKEIERRRAELFFQARQQEWNQVFSAKEKQEDRQLAEIREQLKVLAKQTKKLNSNLQKAVDAPIVKAGVYHESFFVHIRKIIQIFSLQVQEANSWLELYHSRTTKKGVYWSMAKSKGSSYTQSNERVVATSVG